MKHLIMVVAVSFLIAGCSAMQPATDTRTVRGILKHYPSDVRSVQAWYGHNFMIDGTPILPSDRVSEDVLRKYVGRLVSVSGAWQPGSRWMPSAEEQNTQMPVDPRKEIVIKGDGLLATSITIVEK